MDTLRALVVFMSTVENGSFSDAARRLGVSPAAVSQSIARLEQELDVRLFNRTTRQLTLTEDGRRFYDSSRGPALQLDYVINELRDSGNEPTGLLRISLPNSFGRRFVLPLLKEFNIRYPRIQLYIGVGDSGSDLIEDGFDVGISIESSTDSRVSVRSLTPINQYVVASPEYWEKHGKPEGINDLYDHDCINYQIPSTGRISKWNFMQKGERVALDVTGTYTCNDVEAILSLAASGCGVAQVVGYAVAPYLRSGELVSVLDQNVAQTRSINICFPHGDRLALRTRVFVDYIVEKLMTHPDIVSA